MTGVAFALVAISLVEFAAGAIVGYQVGKSKANEAARNRAEFAAHLRSVR